MSSPGPSLAALSWPRRTERLVLRPATDADVDAVLAYRSREDVATYLNRGPLTRQEVADRFVAGGEGTADRPAWALQGLLVERRGVVVGDCVLRLDEDDDGMPVGVIGYTIHPDHAGRGLATEVARELVRICFTELQLAMVSARVFVPHRGSQRVLEKAGLRCVETRAAGSEGEGRPRMDDFLYAVSAAEWAAHHSS